MKKVLEKLINSFDNENAGFSARKLSAFVGVILSVFLSIKYCDKEILETVITIWLGFGLLCLGIITMQQIISFKNGNNDEK